MITETQMDLLGAPEAAPVVKALSLWEPWGTAMALDLKRNETRDWATSHRGELVICSAKRPMDKLGEDLCGMVGIDPKQVIYGHALCVVEVYDCVRTEDVYARTEDRERLLGNYDAGRFAWLTRNVRRFANPFPIIGGRGIFHIPKALVNTALNA